MTSWMSGASFANTLALVVHVLNPFPFPSSRLACMSFKGLCFVFKPKSWCGRSCADYFFFTSFSLLINGSWYFQSQPAWTQRTLHQYTCRRYERAASLLHAVPWLWRFQPLLTVMTISDKFETRWDPVNREFAWALLREFVVSVGSLHQLLRSDCQHPAEGWR